MDLGNGNKVRRIVRFQPRRSSARLRSPKLPFEVFGNELLRKKIVEYVIFSGDSKKENQSNACSLRLVGKSWNETVIKLLYQRQKPLCEVSTYPLCNYQSLCSLYPSSTPLNNGSIPPFSLQITYYEGSILKKILTKFGSGLLQLNVFVGTKEKCKRPFPDWSLPHLGKLDVSITLDSEVALLGGEDGGEAVASALFKALCKAATNSDITLTLVFGSPLINVRGQISHHSILESIAIPSTITKLKLKNNLQNADVEVLASKILPNITELSLYVTYDFLEDGSFFKILDIYRVSLRKLSIRDFSYRSYGSPPTLIWFPVMENLEELFFNPKNLELEPGLVSLPRFFPTLRTWRFHNLYFDTLRKMTECSIFTSVTAFTFSGNTFSWNMERTQSINFAFPNVRKLNLTFSEGESSGLKYLFQEMTQLTELTLVCRRNWPVVDPNFWDAVLTGVSLETVAESREDPGFWERFDMNEEEEALSSIKNLRELTSLTLSGYHRLDYQQPLLISDVTFKRALLKMPKLKKLYLCGSFLASAEMSEEWRNGGRFLEYKNLWMW